MNMKTLAAKLAVIPLVFAATARVALAELPASVKTETDGYKADTIEALGMIIAAGIAIWALKKLGNKI
ncbi:hypothetical protein AVHM3334_09490 [Acidovorax sp. SUPP3334]|nr:hypothetical protein AVHM3334_09490 [Acidovorax sp. SUPP3334]